MHAREFLIPIITELLKDTNDSVKIHSVVSSIDVAKVADDPILIRENIIPAFAASCENRFSWRLRFSIAE